MYLCRRSPPRTPRGLLVAMLLLPLLAGCTTATFDSIMLPGKFPNPRPLFASSEQDTGYMDVFDVCVDTNGVHPYWNTLPLDVVSLATGRKAKLYIGVGTGFGDQYLGAKSIARISCPEGRYALRTVRSPNSPDTLFSTSLTEGITVKKGKVCVVCIETFPETATESFVKAKATEVALLPLPTADASEARAELVRLLASSAYQQQNYAIRCLGIIGDTDSVPALENALKRDPRHGSYVEAAIAAIKTRSSRSEP